MLCVSLVVRRGTSWWGVVVGLWSQSHICLIRIHSVRGGHEGNYGVKLVESNGNISRSVKLSLHKVEEKTNKRFTSLDFGGLAWDEIMSD